MVSPGCALDEEPPGYVGQWMDIAAAVPETQMTVVGQTPHQGTVNTVSANGAAYARQANAEYTVVESCFLSHCELDEVFPTANGVRADRCLAFLFRQCQLARVTNVRHHYAWPLRCHLQR